MLEGGLPHHAAFWRDEYAKRWVQRRATRMSPRTNHRWVRALEIAGQPQLELNFDHPPDGTGPPTQTHVLAPSAVADLPGDPDTGLPPAGQWWRPVRVHQLSDVVLDVPTGLMFHRGRVISQSGRGDRGARDAAFLSGAFRRAGAGATATRTSPTAALGQTNSFSHFLLETVTRALWIQQCEPAVRFVVDEDPPPFAGRILDWLEIPWDREPPATTLACEAAWLAEAQPMFRPHPADIAMLRAQVVGRTTPAASPYGPRLYISRGGSSRSISDESVLVDHLQEHGFTPIRCEDLPFREQVAAFAGAEAVVGAHGAGLANAAFMARGGLAEFSTGAWWYPTFRFLAGGTGLSYDYVPLTATSSAPEGAAHEAVERLHPILARLGG